MQECGRLWSVKLTERVSVGERSWKNRLCKRRQRSNCVLATVWNKCTTLIGKLFSVSFHWHSTAQSPFSFDRLFPPPPFWQDEVRLSREQFCLINLLLDENNTLGIATGSRTDSLFPRCLIFLQQCPGQKLLLGLRQHSGAFSPLSVQTYCWFKVCYRHSWAFITALVTLLQSVWTPRSQGLNQRPTCHWETPLSPRSLSYVEIRSRSATNCPL